MGGPPKVFLAWGLWVSVLEFRASGSGLMGLGFRVQVEGSGSMGLGFDDHDDDNSGSYEFR